LHHTTKLLNDVALVSINNEGTREINYGNCIADSRPDRFTIDTQFIGGSNNKNGVYPTTKFLNGVALVSIEVMEFEKLIMEIESQIHAPTALPPVLIG
jgi:hypothetical protein